MIDFTTVPLYEPLPNIQALNYENFDLIEENKFLKNVITALIVGVLVYWVYQSYSIDKEQKTLDRK